MTATIPYVEPVFCSRCTKPTGEVLTSRGQAKTKLYCDNCTGVPADYGRTEEGDEDMEDHRPRCECGSLEFYADETRTSSWHGDGESYGADTIRFDFSYSDGDINVSCQNCGAGANHLNWDIV